MILKYLELLVNIVSVVLLSIFGMLFINDRRE